MKKSILIISLVIVSMIMLTSSIFADFNDSFRKVNSMQIMEDDWDYILNPMFYSGLKGKFVTVGMDNSWAANAFYAGAGLDLFGLKETLALRYSETAFDNLDTTETEAKTTINNTNYRTVQTSKNEETIDSTTARNLDIHAGVGFGMGDMDLGIGVRINSVNANSTENESTISGETKTNGVVSAYALSEDNYQIIKNGSSYIGLLLGLSAKAIQAQVGFSLDTYKGTGSKREYTTQQKDYLARLTDKDTLMATGDYITVNGDPLDSAFPGVARSGISIQAEARIDLGGTTLPLRPGIRFMMTSAGIDEDEKEIKAEQTDYDYSATGIENDVNTVTTSYLFDTADSSSTTIEVFDHSIFKVADGINIATGLGYILGLSDTTILVKKTETTIQKTDNNANQSYADAGDVNTVTVQSGLDDEKTIEGSSHTIYIPLFVEFGIAKGLSLRAGTQINYIISSSKTVTTTYNAYPNVAVTDNNTPANNTKAVQNYTKTITTDDVSSTSVTKSFRFGAGYDVTENISLDFLVDSTTLIRLDQVLLEGTLRF